MDQCLFEDIARDAGEIGRAAVEQLAASATTTRAWRNELVYEQGDANDGVHIVVHGAVLLEWTRRRGVAVGFRLALAGDDFGARSFCAGEPHSASARAARETQVLHVPARALQHALAEVPKLWRILARRVARDTGPQLAKVLRDAHIPARVRLAWLLADLHDRLDSRVAPPVGHPDSPVRQRDLAHLLDVADETVSRSIAALEEAGLLRAAPDTGGLVIPDREALEAAFADWR